MFAITEEKQNDLHIVKITNTLTEEYISIVPEFGANINDIVLKRENKFFHLLDGNLTLESFVGRNIFKGAKLFPFPNRIKYGRYEFRGKKYQLPINYEDEGNAAHRLVYNKKFQLFKTSISSDKAEASFKYKYDGSLSGFPFAFEIILSYLLHKRKEVVTTTKVKNISNNPFPFGDGWHPFIKLGGKIDKLYLKFESKELIITDDNFTPISKRPYKTFEKFKRISNTKFDNCFHLKSQKKHIIELYEPKKKIKFYFGLKAVKANTIIYNYILIL